MEHLSIFIVKHPTNTSHEVALEEALAIDKAIQNIGLQPVGGAYTQQGDATSAAVAWITQDP